MLPKKRAAVRAESKSAASKCNCEANAERWQVVLDEKSEEFDSLHSQWLDTVAENLHLATNAEADELMLAKQRERLIRLTEIVDLSKDLYLTSVRGFAIDEKTFEVSGTLWYRSRDLMKFYGQLKSVHELIAALDVDTAIPPRRKP
jgi:hypothetical protein